MHPGAIATQTPEKSAYIMADTGQAISFQELEEQSNRGAHLFRALGLKAGDHIALMMENHPLFLQICWAAQRSGIYYTAIAYKLQHDEVSYILQDCGAKIFITSTSLKELATKVAKDSTGVKHCFMLDNQIEGFANWQEALNDQPATPIEDEQEGCDMLYSSGTTGRPKGIKIPLNNTPLGSPNPLCMLINALYMPDQEPVTYLSPAPLYHAAPLRYNMNMLRIGATCIIMEQFEPEQALKLIEQYQVTHSQWVPTMFVRILKLPEEIRNQYDISSLKIAIHAAAPCPVSVKLQMIEWWGPVIHEYYAGTEGNCYCTINSEEWLNHQGSVGRPILGELKILDDNEEQLPTGEIGGIYVANGNTFEYHNDKEKTAKSRSKQGWTTLGDVGYVDEEGFLYLTDRKAYMIISGGVNIYPQEAEDILVTHPKVNDVAVLGIPNEDFGEEVKGVVEPADWSQVGPELEAELIEYCRSKLSHIKCPRSIDFEKELPRHPTGKLLKRLLKDRYWKTETA